MMVLIPTALYILSPQIKSCVNTVTCGSWMLGCTAIYGQQSTNKTPADSGGVIIRTSTGGVMFTTNDSLSGCCSHVSRAVFLLCQHLLLDHLLFQHCTMLIYATLVKVHNNSLSYQQFELLNSNRRVHHGHCQHLILEYRLGEGSIDQGDALLR